MNFGRNTAWALVASVGSGPLVLLSAVVLARWLSPAENGQMQAALSLLALLATVGNGGLVAATIQRLRAGDAAHGTVVGSALLGVTGVGALAMLGLVAAGPWMRAHVLLDLSPVAYVGLGAAVLPLLWGSVLGASARGLDRFAWWSRAELGDKGMRLAGFAVVAVVWPPSVAYGLAIVCAVQLGVTWGLWTRVRKAVAPVLTSPAELGVMARFGASAWATTVAHQLHERVDLVLLAVIRGDPVEVAAYAVAVGVVHRLRMVPLALASALYPQVAGMEGPAGAELAARVCRVALASAVGLGLVVAAVALWAFPMLFGPAYAASVAPAWVLLPGVAALTPYVVLSRWFQAVDRQRVNVATLGLAVVVNIGLNLLWIPTYGAVGAAGASLVSYGLQGLVVGGAFSRATRTSPLAWLVARPGDVAALRSTP